MRNCKFHYLGAKNILCFGEKGISVHFVDYGNIVLVRGINHDAPGTKEFPASNGAGKSSLQEILSIGLYGSAVKNPTKCNTSSFLNCKANKGEIEIQWDDYRLIRTYTRTKSGTITCKMQMWKSQDHIWDDDSYWTKSIAEIENEIEKSLGLNHHAFCNVAIFDDSKTYSFMEANAEKKREIVESLLDLERYRQYHKNAKELLKDVKKVADGLTLEYTRLRDEAEASGRRLNTVRQQEGSWKTLKLKEINDLSVRLARKQEELETGEDGKALANWQANQDKIANMEGICEEERMKCDRLRTAVEEAKKKLEEAREAKADTHMAMKQIALDVHAAKEEIEKLRKQEENLEDLKDGTPCPVCHATVNRANYGDVLVHCRHRSGQVRLALEGHEKNLTEMVERLEKRTQIVKMMESKIHDAEMKMKTLEFAEKKLREEITTLSKMPRPEADSVLAILEVEISEIKKQIKAKKVEVEGDSPYREIIVQAEQDLLLQETKRDAKSAELKAKEEEIPYLSYWVEAYGDNGIRKHIIEGVVPTLNSRMNYWMEVLYNGVLSVTFDNQLDYTISRSGNPAQYHRLSNGECQRVNLAVPQSFSYIMTLNAGTCPSIIFLDEITGGGIDRAGISSVYNLIVELAKERQVFVTTHNDYLLSLLQGCQTITLEKKNDVTELAS